MAAEPLQIEDARRLVLERTSPVGPERIEVRRALGRVLAEDVTSAEAVPGFDNSAMDGFAVRSADLTAAAPGSPGRLRVAGESRAGHPAAMPLGPGEAIRISTGAMLPDGADAVIRVEEAVGHELDGAAEELVTDVCPQPGRDIRRAGEDIQPGDQVIAAGTAIGPARLGVL